MTQVSRAPADRRFAARTLSYGPVALVTGASDGIGEAFGRELARRGYDIILVARRRDRLEAISAEIAAAYGVDTSVIAADLGCREGVDRVLSETAGADIGLFVAAAGFGSSGPLVDQPVDNELNMVDVNCRAVVALTHAFSRRFVARGRGGIVLLSSLVAFQGVPRAATYAATKAFVQSFAEGLRPELKSHNVDVIACAPGPVDSGFARRADMVMGFSDRPGVVAGETLDRLGRRGVVRPGRLAKLLEASFTGMPRWGRVLIMAKVMKGMTRGGPVAGPWQRPEAPR
jgi:short-subunit dehydrogenase